MKQIIQQLKESDLTKDKIAQLVIGHKKVERSKKFCQCFLGFWTGFWCSCAYMVSKIHNSPMDYRIFGDTLIFFMIAMGFYGVYISHLPEYTKKHLRDSVTAARLKQLAAMPEFEQLHELCCRPYITYWFYAEKHDSEYQQTMLEISALWLKLHIRSGIVPDPLLPAELMVERAYLEPLNIADTW